MSAFAFTKKRCGKLELNKQPGRGMELITIAVPLPVAGFLVNQRILSRNQIMIKGTANSVWGFVEACSLSFLFVVLALELEFKC